MATDLPPRRPRGLGYASLAFGALGLFFLCAPAMGLILSGMGVLLGVAALLRGHGRGFSASGFLLSAAALAVNLWLPATLPNLFPEGFRWFDRHQSVKDPPGR